MAWHKTKKASKLPGMDKSKILVFDTETTGLEPVIDEILQITILDGYGSILFNSYIKPNHHKRWPGAKKVNHISYEMVKTAPTFKEVRSQIQDIFNKAELVVGYNVNFDINFVEAAGIIVSGKKFDVMTAFSSFYSDVEKAVYKWHTLTVCADYFGYSFNAHDSAEDAAATLYCFNGLISDERFTTYEPKKSVYQYRKPRTEKKKVAFSIEVKAQRRSTLLFRGMLLIFIGEIIYYLRFQCSKDENEIYFQNIGKKALVQKKRFVIFSDCARYLPESNSFLIKDCPDAIYIKDKDILLFQKLSSITSIFKGIDELYKEATNQETKAFLELDFIASEGIAAEEVNTLNRRRIAQATRILKCMDNDQKKIIHDYISDYCPKLRDKENRFKVTNNEDLSMVLYGIQERYYTTLVGQEKGIANSKITL